MSWKVVFANVGEGAAKSVAITSHLATDLPKEEYTGHKNFVVPGLNALRIISGLPAGKEIAIPLGMAHKVMAVNGFWPITVTIDVEDMHGIHLQASVYHLDGRELRKFNKTGDAAINDIASDTRKLAELLQAVIDGQKAIGIDVKSVSSARPTRGEDRHNKVDHS
jgi:hypothetical protein